MLCIRVRDPSLKYEFDTRGRSSTLWLDGTLASRLRGPSGTRLNVSIQVAIDSRGRAEPHRVGSILLHPQELGVADRLDVWLHADQGDIEAMFSKLRSERFVYFVVNAPTIVGDNLNSPTSAVDSFSLRVSGRPCFDDLNDSVPN